MRKSTPLPSASLSSMMAHALGGRPLLLAVFLFTLGICFSAYISGIAEFAVCISAIFTLAGTLGSRRFPLICFILISFSFFLWGLTLAQLQARVSLPDLLNDEEVIEGRVESVSEVREKRTYLTLEVARVIREQTSLRARFRIRLTVDGNPAIFPGDALRAKVRLHPIDGPQNWGVSDLRPGYAAQGVLFFGRVVRGQWSAIGESPRAVVFQRDYRKRFTDLCDRALSGKSVAELVRTLGLGDRAALSEETLEDFRVTGLAHLLSVSGLHVGVVALGFYRFLRWLLTRFQWLILRMDILWCVSLSTLPVSWGYVFLTGAEIPAVRAGVMVSTLLAARILGREQDTLSALCLAALFILACDPAALHAVSFQLSFVAVGSLLLLQPPLRAMFPRLSPAHEEVFSVSSTKAPRVIVARGMDALLSTVAATMAASLATAPIVASAFQQTSLIAVFANAIALPIGSALTVFSASAALLMRLCEPAAALILCLADPLAKLLLGAVNFMATAPFASLDVSPPPLLAIVAFYATLLALPLRCLSSRASVFLAISGILVLVAAVALPALGRRSDTSLRVTFFAVGQGDATLIRFPDGRTMLIDGGGDPEGRWKVGARTLLPALRSLGIYRLDVAVLSHPHPDHALGLIEVAQALDPREVWLAVDRGHHKDSLAQVLIDVTNGAKVRRFALGDQHSFGNVKLEILHPPRDMTGLGENEASLVMRLSWGKISFLFTGDLEKAGERMLLDSYADLNATVIKVPHHGSRTSSSLAFVEAVSPRHAVFSCGRRNIFGFPNPDVVERYLHQGSAIHRTDWEGAITFVTDGSALRIEKPFKDERGAKMARRFLRSELDVLKGFEAKARSDVLATKEGNSR